MIPGPDHVARLLLLGRREGGMVSLEEASRVLGVPRNQVVRVMERLGAGELGVPPFVGDDVVTVGVEGGWIRVHVPDELGTGWPFHPADAACIVAALRTLRNGLAAPLRARCDDLIARLAAAVDPAVRDEVESRARSLAWGVSEAVDRAVMDVLVEAARRRERVRLVYYNASRDAVQERDVLALRLLQHGERWYLCGREPNDGRIRWLRVDRVLDAASTGELHDAEPPTEAQLRRPTLFDEPDAPLRAEVRFDAAQAARAARWFGGAAARREDGSVVHVVTTPTWPVLLRRLLAFGTGWEILAPDEARAEVARWATRMAQR